MKNKRGKKRKHWAESARVRAWYNEIRKRTDWSDYQLDAEFALRPEDRHPAENTGSKPRVFEYIRKEDRQSQEDSQYRSIDELVDAVEEHPLFKGTKPVYNAEIWNILQEVSMAADHVMDRIERACPKFCV